MLFRRPLWTTAPWTSSRALLALTWDCQNYWRLAHAFKSSCTESFRKHVCNPEHELQLICITTATAYIMVMSAAHFVSVCVHVCVWRWKSATPLCLCSAVLLVRWRTCISKMSPFHRGSTVFHAAGGWWKGFERTTATWKAPFKVKLQPESQTLITCLMLFKPL